MDSFGLLLMSDRLDIPVYDFKTGTKKAFCTDSSIAINFQRIDSERECKRILAEELGHILSGSLYPLSYCGDDLRRMNIEKAERTAKNCAIRLYIPLNELKTAIENSSDDYEIAEKLDIDLTELSDAVEYYETKGLL